MSAVATAPFLCRLLSAWALSLIIPLPAPAQTIAPTEPLQTIERLDVGLDLGSWYEIAKVPNRFSVSA
jgi:lipocalin